MKTNAFNEVWKSFKHRELDTRNQNQSSSTQEIFAHDKMWLPVYKAKCMKIRLVTRGLLPDCVLGDVSSSD